MRRGCRRDETATSRLGTTMAVALCLSEPAVAARSATAATIRHKWHAASASVSVGATCRWVDSTNRRVSHSRAGATDGAGTGQVTAQGTTQTSQASQEIQDAAAAKAAKAETEDAAATQAAVTSMAAQMTSAAAEAESAIAAQTAEADAAATIQAAEIENATATHAPRAEATSAAV